MWERAKEAESDQLASVSCISSGSLVVPWLKGRNGQLRERVREGNKEEENHPHDGILWQGKCFVFGNSKSP